MSFVLDQVRRIDAQLDRVQLSNLPSVASRVSTSSSDDQSAIPSARDLTLQAAIRGLTPSSSDRNALLRPADIQTPLSALSNRPEAAASTAEGTVANKDQYETELEWLLASKATNQVYGHVLDSILGSAVRIANDLWYWEEVLGSRRYTALYSLQISPLRLWDWSSSVWSDVKARGGNFSFRGARQDAQNTVTQSWHEFYGLVRQVVKERSIAEVNKQMLSPVTRIRHELREKQKCLRKIRLRNANALGVLLGEGLANESAHGEGLATPSPEDTQQKWKASVARNVALMEAVLAKVNDLETPVDKFDTAIGELTEDDPLYTVEISDQSGVSVQPQAVAERLSRVLTLALPQYTSSTNILIQEHGKPSRIIRYWLPVTVAVLSSSTVLRILVNRKAEVIQWIQDLGATIIDFWTNWIVEPTRKVIKTIRHDEGSEVSIMSKRSLEGDRDSLERMVVDFAIENPENATDSGAPLTELQIADIRAKVREGDLTPVLKAYEKDLSKPFMGTVRGNLIRALLIQVQKTKVDVEVAMGGIDALLKSQELVFGFVGLTPGILVTYFCMRSLRSSLSEKRGTKAARKQGKMLRQLRNIDRILVDSVPTDFGELHYRDQGLLLCEVHVLRQAADKVMPVEIYREFSEEAEELCDVRIGVEKQKKVADRVRWAYARWLS
ncbi:Nuclear control of ATPase protein 2 [Vermiconidia calcicola]|uniref:Nuclear control of ATPase protein 2 n=1 Tax=Vermiconidia calcicola TaxID=1690605 RepID=A0ACC3MWT6_9PEZI|nr:Nuclear control of ATPase protein 2 [Vermiconidia calcicola]